METDRSLPFLVIAIFIWWFVNEHLISESTITLFAIAHWSKVNSVLKNVLFWLFEQFLPKAG